MSDLFTNSGPGAAATTPRPESNAKPDTGKANTQPPVSEVEYPYSGMSLFASGFAKEPAETMNLAELVRDIRNGKWRKQIERLREILEHAGKDAYDAEKPNLPCVSISGVIEGLRKAAPGEGRFLHSGFLQGDFDAKDHPDLDVDEMLEILRADPHVEVVFRSPSNLGAKAVIRVVQDITRHRDSFRAAQAHFARVGLVIDEATKDPNRLCFVSFDPDARLRSFGDDAEILQPALPEVKPEPRPEPRPAPEPSRHYEEDKVATIRRLLDCIPPRPDYPGWILVCSAVWNELGEAGTPILEVWSPEERSGEYGAKFRDRLTEPKMGALVNLAKSHGYAPEYRHQTSGSRSGNTSGAGPANGNEVDAVAARLAEIASRTIVKMGDYESISALKSRDLLPRCIWDSILREGCLAILGGESKAKKSWFSLAFGMHAVSCTPFLGIAIPAPLEGDRRVVILDYELLEANIMSRFISLAEKFDQDEPAWRAIWDRMEIRCHRSMLAEEVGWIDYCCAVVRQSNRGDLVVVDCLQALPTGDANDPQAVRRVLGKLQSAATDSCACVVIVDHFSKSTEARGMNRISGSMAKAATPDAILLLESDGKDFIKFSTELRMDPPRDPLTLEFRSPSEGFRLVGEEEREERKEGAKAKRESERLAAMFPEVGRDYTVKELAANIGKTTKTAEGWMKEFPDFITTKEGTGKNPHLYSRKL